MGTARGHFAEGNGAARSTRGDVMTLLLELLQAVLVFTAVLGVATGVQLGWRWYRRRDNGPATAGMGRGRQ